MSTSVLNFKCLVNLIILYNPYFLDIEDWNKIGYEDVSDVVLSLVGSLVFGFTVGASFLSSPIIAKLGYQKTGMIGVTTGIISLCLTAWSPSFWWWFLTYSVMFGLRKGSKINFPIWKALFLFQILTVHRIQHFNHVKNRFFCIYKFQITTNLSLYRLIRLIGF